MTRENHLLRVEPAQHGAYKRAVRRTVVEQCVEAQPRRRLHHQCVAHHRDAHAGHRRRLEGEAGAKHLRRVHAGVRGRRRGVDARRQEEARAFRWTTVHTTQNRLCVWRLSFTVHGGGRRCQHEGCTKSACDGGSPHCSAHGRGRRCQHEGCTKASATNGGTPHCIAHGGGRPAGCQHEGCSKLAQGGGTPHCSAHGGGRRCQHEGCTKGAGGGGTPHCSEHGGGWRCQQEGCPK
jgi:hypothetical protein